MDQVGETQLFSESLCDCARDILGFCHNNSFILGTGESLTGGLLGALFTSIPGASETYAGGFITYQTEQKRQLIDVSDGTLRKYGPVSEQCAQEMARGVQNRLNVECVIVTTGVAGPSRDEFGVPVGIVFVAAACGDSLQTFKYSFDPESGRQGICMKTLCAGLSDSLAFFKRCV